MIKALQKEIANRQAILSPATQQVIKNELTRLATSLDVTFNLDEADTYIYTSEVTVVAKAEASYDNLMADKDSFIGNISMIENIKDHSVILCSHNNLELKVSLRTHCALPESDLNTLRMLGKVKMSRGYVSPPTESVSCSIL